MVAMASLGLWSGSTAARHVEDSSKSAPKVVEMIKIDLPVIVASVAKSGETPTYVRASYAVTIPTNKKSNPALNDMLSDAFLKATVEAFSNPTKEMLSTPEIAANKIVNLANEKLVDVTVDELHVSNLAAFKYSR